MGIVSRRNPLIDGHQAFLQLVLQVREMFLNRLGETGQARLGEELAFVVLPAVLRDEVILETAKTDTIAAEDIASFEAMAEEPIDQELIAIGEQGLGPMGLGPIHVAFRGRRDTSPRHCGHWIGTEGPSFPYSLLQKLDRVHQRALAGGSSPIYCEENRPQMQFK